MDAKKREIRNLECQLAFREASSEASEKGILGVLDADVFSEDVIDVLDRAAL